MNYRNFNAAIFFTEMDVSSFKDRQQLETEFAGVEKNIRVGKVYLETFRSDQTVDKKQIFMLNDFFKSKGIKTSGAITTTRASKGIWKTFCYSGSEDREKLKEVVKLTASIFDEIILDDFFFTNCKCESCIAGKGEKTWAEYRVKLLNDAAVECVIKPAKEINPGINLIIKFPNWYEHYQNDGYNLKDEPAVFDMIYTGTETRDPEYTQQHLQSYLSYFLMRYMENVKPGKNGGGWFDTFDCYNPVNYIEQLNLTLFSKAKEATLFLLSSD